MTRFARPSCLSQSCCLRSALPHCARRNARRQGRQGQRRKNKPAEPAPKAKEESSVTDHTLKIGGQTIPYKATASTILLKNEKDEPTALIYSTAYTRTDAKDATQRPLSFIYNGGPGSASLWLHMGAFGPRRVVTTDAEPTPPPPYKLVDNAGTLLDKTDMVFIDPVGTGFSHAVGKAQDKDFWGVDQDVKSLAQFISHLRQPQQSLELAEISDRRKLRHLPLRRARQLSAAARRHVSQRYRSHLFGSRSRHHLFPPGDDMSYIFYVPSYAATAWYHKVLPDRPADLKTFIDEARQFAQTEYAAALIKGSQAQRLRKSGCRQEILALHRLERGLCDQGQPAREAVRNSWKSCSALAASPRAASTLAIPASPTICSPKPRTPIRRATPSPAHSPRCSTPTCATS